MTLAPHICDDSLIYLKKLFSKSFYGFAKSFLFLEIGLLAMKIHIFSTNPPPSTYTFLKLLWVWTIFVQRNSEHFYTTMHYILPWTDFRCNKHLFLLKPKRPSWPTIIKYAEGLIYCLLCTWVLGIKTLERKH